MAILLDFVIIKNMTEPASFVKPVKPDEGTVDSQPDLPRADAKKCVCNFSSFPNINGVFVNEERPFCYDDVTDDATGTALESLTLSDNVMHGDDDDCFTDEDAFDGDDYDGHGDDDGAVENDDEDSHDQKQRIEEICYSEVMRIIGRVFMITSK